MPIFIFDRQGKKHRHNLSYCEAFQQMDIEKKV